MTNTDRLTNQQADRAKDKNEGKTMQVNIQRKGMVINKQHIKKKLKQKEQGKKARNKYANTARVRWGQHAEAHIVVKKEHNSTATGK